MSGGYQRLVRLPSRVGCQYSQFALAGTADIRSAPYQSAKLSSAPFVCLAIQVPACSTDGAHPPDQTALHRLHYQQQRPGRLTLAPADSALRLQCTNDVRATSMQ